MSESMNVSTSSGSVPSSQISAVDTANFASRWRAKRSCARCHRLRAKCAYDDPAYASCRRCFAIGVECSLVNDPTSAIAKKRPRKKDAKKMQKDHLATLQGNIKEIFDMFVDDQGVKKEDGEDGDVKSDPRIAQAAAKVDNLEKIYDIQTQLTELQQFLTHVIDSSSAKAKVSYSSSSINSMKEGPVKLIPRYPSIPYQLNIMKELLKLKLITRSDSEGRFQHFQHHMLSYWPNVSLPPTYFDFSFLLENRPLILLACISVTALNEPDLHDLLMYYLERSLAQRVSITGDLSVDLMYVYIILSLWASPPKKWGSFKHHMHLLMAFNLSLCLDSPNAKFRSSEKVLYANSEERKLIRCYVSIYTCCGCLGLSLPKFRCVQWNKDVAACCDILLMGETCRADKFLSYYARLVATGQEVYSYFTEDEKINQLQLGDKISDFETKLQKIVSDTEFFTPDSKERFLLMIVYYQIVMTMYDYVVCDVVKGHSTVISSVYLSSLSKLIRSCEKVVDAFVNLLDETSNFPTFFYYRPMHALVALIRARLLVVYEKLDFDVNVQREFDRVKECLDMASKKSLVARKMAVILTKVERWMQISVTFHKEGATNSMEALLGELGDEKIGVENLKPPPSVPSAVSPDDMALADRQQDMPHVGRFPKNHQALQAAAHNQQQQHQLRNQVQGSQQVPLELQQQQQHHQQQQQQQQLLSRPPTMATFSSSQLIPTPHAAQQVPPDESSLQDFFNEIDSDFLNIQFMDSEAMFDSFGPGNGAAAASAISNFELMNNFDNSGMFGEVGEVDDQMSAAKQEQESELEADSTPVEPPSVTRYAAGFAPQTVAPPKMNFIYNLDATGQTSRQNSVD